MEEFPVKNFLLALVASLVIGISFAASAQEATSTVDAKKNEAKTKMADLKKKFAACVAEGKTPKDCHQSLAAECPNFKDGKCPGLGMGPGGEGCPEGQENCTLGTKAKGQAKKKGQGMMQDGMKKGKGMMNKLGIPGEEEKKQ